MADARKTRYEIESMIRNMLRYHQMSSNWLHVLNGLVMDCPNASMGLADDVRSIFWAVWGSEAMQEIRASQ